MLIKLRLAELEDAAPGEWAPLLQDLKRGPGRSPQRLLEIAVELDRRVHAQVGWFGRVVATCPPVSARTRRVMQWAKSEVYERLALVEDDYDPLED